MRAKRTKKRYAELYDNPTALFGNGPDNSGVETILFPNGENELWISDSRGHGVSIKASSGPAGMGLVIRAFVGSTPLTVRAYDASYAPAPSVDGVKEVCITAYNPDERSQAFKRWYDEQATETDIALLGPSYRRIKADKS